MLVFHIGLQNLQAIEFRRQAGGDGRRAFVAQLGHMLGRACRVVPVMRHQLALLQQGAALGQCRRLAVNTCDVIKRRILDAQQLMADGQEMLGHDMEP